MKRLESETLSTDHANSFLIHYGFLKEGQTLKQVVKRDQEVLKILGYSTQEVADLLADICETNCQENNFVYTALNRKRYKVVIERSRGIKRCPWQDFVNLKKSPSFINFYINEVDKTERIRIPGLLRHLIEKHGFFEGGLYRVAPETIVEMFGIERIPGSIELAKKLLLTDS